MAVEIPTMMKAAVVEKFGEPLVVKQLPVPEPGYGQVLIKVICSGVCHTDLHVRDGDWHVKPALPIVPGHEGAGVVVKLGEGVKTLKIGDRVGHAWLHDSCGGCDYCLSGWETVCGTQHQTGFAANGCFAEYTVAEAGYVGRIPDELSFSQAAPILCAGVTTYKALKETEAKPGQWVAILGACGGLGHVGCQYATAMGLKCCAVDFGEDKRDYALKTLKCSAYVDVKGKTPEEIVNAVKKACDGVGAHGSLILAPRPESFRQGVDMLRPMGFAVGISLPPGEFPVDIFSMILHRKTIRGSIVGTRKDLNECLCIAGDGKVECTVSERKLEDINDIFTEMAKGKIRGRCVLRIAPDDAVPTKAAVARTCKKKGKKAKKAKAEISRESDMADETQLQPVKGKRRLSDAFEEDTEVQPNGLAKKHHQNGGSFDDEFARLRKSFREEHKAYKR